MKLENHAIIIGVPKEKSRAYFFQVLFNVQLLSVVCTEKKKTLLYNFLIILTRVAISLMHLNRTEEFAYYGESTFS